jgi:prepilin-type N-terminal cleavage/methylation domain-containing protein
MNKYNKAFTLLELLVVIAIIGVLASIVMASLNSSRNKAATTFVEQTADQIRKQMELYYGQYGNYGEYASNMAVFSGYGSAGYAGYVNFPGGAGDCSVPYSRQSISDIPGTLSYQVALLVGKGMEKTIAYPSGNGIGFWCYTSPDRQSYAFAFYGLKTGLNTLCVDSSGSFKRVQTTYGVSPINAFNSSIARCL